MRTFEISSSLLTLKQYPALRTRHGHRGASLTLRASAGLQQRHRQIAWICDKLITERLRQHKLGSWRPLFVGTERGVSTDPRDSAPCRSEISQFGRCSAILPRDEPITRVGHPFPGPPPRHCCLPIVVLVLSLRRRLVLPPVRPVRLPPPY